MLDFFQAVQTMPFMQSALLVGVLASIACGIVGSYVVARRITYIAGGISHCILGGIGGAIYLKQVCGWSWITPLMGALVAALAAAIIIGLVSMRSRQREDTVIGAIWAVGMAVGVLFIAITPGYSQDLMSFLFGNILMTSRTDVYLIIGLDAIVISVGLLFYRQILAVCFDEEFARTRGIQVEFYYLTLLCLTALTVVLLVSVVGIVLVIALLTLPAAVAGYFSRTLWQMMILSILFSSLFTVTGLAISYAPGLPTGAMIICVAGAAYLVLAVAKGILGRKKER